MYQVSNDYLAAITSNARAAVLRGTVGGVSFTGSDVIRNSFAVRNQICPATEITLGGVYIGEMDLTLTEAFAASLDIRGSWRGVTITAFIGVELEDSTFEDVPVPGGTYTIEQATWTDAGLEIVAYDNMAKFDKIAQFSFSSGTLYDYLVFICAECNVALGMTEAQCEALPNGLYTLGVYPGSAAQTYRDMISMLASIASCFATIDRSGQLVFRRLPDTSSVTAVITHKQRYSTSFSDFASFYSAVEVEEMQDGDIKIYENDNPNGLTMELGANPFLQYGTSETIYKMRQAVANGLEPFRAVPFSVSLLPNPALDLGDVIRFTGGIGGGAVGCIMSFTMKVDATIIEGYGENPSAAGAQTVTDKKVTANAANSRKEGMAYYPFINVDAITLTTAEKTLYEIDFATAESTTVTLWHELKILSTLAGDTQVIKLCYYYDGEKIDYEPVNTYGEDGYHLFKGDYWLLNVTPGAAHRFKVTALIDSGSASIAVGDLHAMMMGQKMNVSGTSSGDIYIAERFTPVLIGQELGTFIEAVPVIADTPTLETLNRATMTEDIRETEDGDIRIISDGSEE